MDEYASIRLTLDWATATTLPRVMVTAASPQSTAVMFGWARGSTPPNRRMSAAKTAALEPVAMKAETLVGAPSYTSGAHMWKGTAEILKPNPTRRSPTPARNMAECGRPATAAAMRSKVVL